MSLICCSMFRPGVGSDVLAQTHRNALKKATECSFVKPISSMFLNPNILLS